jgi:CAAX protease family protein
MKRDAVALTVAMLLPSVMTWFEFTLLPADDAASKPFLQMVFLVGKIAQFAFPAVYVFLVDRGHFALSRPSGRALAFGSGLGLVIGLSALGLYWLFLRDTPLMSQTAGPLLRWLVEYHLDTPAGYWTLALLMATLHAFLEEYYWRWFVFRWLHRHMPPGWAVALSSLGFMLHHIVILSVYLPGYFWLGVMPFSLCVGVGGVIWALLYKETRSLYPVWLSHGLVDLALMTVGWDLVSRGW